MHIYLYECIYIIMYIYNYVYIYICIYIGILRSLAEVLDQNISNDAVVATLIGVFSAIIDNVPLVAATMGMYPVCIYVYIFITLCIYEYMYMYSYICICIYTLLIMHP
jgi:Na+/H+ antiporter NhaD/arsenite permease-like protein